MFACILGASRWFMVLVVLGLSSFAMALPTPKDIESAVQAGHLAQAESMLREVIEAKPESAKAHYELGQVLSRQSRYPEAQAALKRAKDLDPSLKFAQSAEKFNEISNKVSQQLANPPKAPANTTSHESAAPLPLTWIWVGIGALGLMAFLIYRNRPQSQNNRNATASMPPRGFGTQYAPVAQAPGYEQPRYGQPGYGQPGYGQPGYAPPTGSGMGAGVAGAVVGGLAGVAAGYALSKAMGGDGNHASSAVAPDQRDYIPLDQPSNDYGSFDSGSGSGWDDGGAFSGDDSW
jgi:hypothetical protein